MFLTGGHSPQELIKIVCLYQMDISHGVPYKIFYYLNINLILTIFVHSQSETYTCTFHMFYTGTAKDIRSKRLKDAAVNDDQ